MDFISLDLETANADISSICRIGLAGFRNGLLREEWKTYIDPGDAFDKAHVSIHGITESAVKGAPTLLDVVDILYHYLDNQITVCHTPLHRVALHQACKKYDLRLPSCTWLDSADVARRAWEPSPGRGDGLADTCAAIGYQFAEHDALERAKATAYILLAAIEKTGIDLRDWLPREGEQRY